jgi:hypothetical protein
MNEFHGPSRIDHCTPYLTAQEQTLATVNYRIRK